MKNGGYDPKKVSDRVLLDDHRITHAYAATLKRGKIKGWTLEKVKKRHAEIIGMMKKRGMNHKTPL